MRTNIKEKKSSHQSGAAQRSEQCKMNLRQRQWLVGTVPAAMSAA